MQKNGTLPRSRRFLAVPFIGKDAPSPSSEYAHPDVAIGLAVLAYRYEGMRRADFGAVLFHLRAEFESEHGPELQRPSSQIWISWVHAAPGGRRVRGTAGARHANASSARAARLAASCIESSMDVVLDGEAAEAQTDVMPLHLIDLNDAEYMELLFQLLNRNHARGAQTCWTCHTLCSEGLWLLAACLPQSPALPAVTAPCGHRSLRPPIPAVAALTSPLSEPSCTAKSAGTLSVTTSRRLCSPRPPLTKPPSSQPTAKTWAARCSSARALASAARHLPSCRLRWASAFTKRYEPAKRLNRPISCAAPRPTTPQLSLGACSLCLRYPTGRRRPHAPRAHRPVGRVQVYPST